MIKKNSQIRNIAIIAHVDHGKTTLVDGLFRQSGLFAQGALPDRIMDSGAIERERGITISAKNCAINWKGVKINIIDTPGHADFGGEVERGLSMVNGVVLLVDAAEGPLPQTRFVLQKALTLQLAVIIVINKIDRQDARPQEVLEEVYDLLLELHPDEAMLEVPVLYCIGREGSCGVDPNALDGDLHALLDIMVETVPAPEYNDEEPFQMLVSDLGYSDFLGRLAIGKVVNGSAGPHDSLICLGKEGRVPLRVTRLQCYDGPTFHETDWVGPGDIVVLSGVDKVSIGDTICTRENPKPLPRITIDEPTVAMQFGKNISPLAGKEGTIVQATKIYERLQKEALQNVSIKVEKNPGDDTVTVKGRGEFQLAIIVESMRREGFELCVGRPTIICKEDENGKKLEPIEYLRIDCPETYSGIVMEKLAKRKGYMLDITYAADDRVTMRFEIPSRALIGYRDEFLTDTRGNGIMHAVLKGYEAYRGDFPDRFSGSLISDRAGTAVAYGLFGLEPRGRLFVTPGDPIYEGMIIGEHNREVDLACNPTRTKKLTNLRAAGKDDAVTLTPISPMSLEQAIRFIKDDELVEVTPKSIRLCKRILKAQQRKIFESRGFIPDYLR
ncbi:MAG: translational GTPase TypA [Sphaerochaetaceae bacterium]|jgi:GTP-binding protein|nr:translational GTPase TypA [Sphaerochaetaceae bacterium]